MPGARSATAIAASQFEAAFPVFQQRLHLRQKRAISLTVVHAVLLPLDDSRTASVCASHCLRDRGRREGRVTAISALAIRG